MGNDRHITQPPTASSPWEVGSYAALTVLIWQVISSRIVTLWGVILSWGAMLVVSAAVYGVFSRCFLYGDIILTPEGIHRERRLKTRDVPWSDIIQAIAMEHENTNVLVLVKKGGFKLTEKCPKGWFFFRNPGKTIFLPDDRFTRPFVGKYYGPLDVDLSGDSSEHSSTVE